MEKNTKGGAVNKKFRENLSSIYTIYDMGDVVVEGGKIGDRKYRIVLISGKYTLFIQTETDVIPDSESIDQEYSAVASFDSKEAAQKYIKELK